MTVGGWLDARTPRPPDALAARVRSVIGARWSEDVGHTRQVCESAAEELLRGLLATHETGRGSALDLLAADALVTYAFEYAAASGEDLDASAGAAMRRLAEMGARFAGGGPVAAG